MIPVDFLFLLGGLAFVSFIFNLAVFCRVLKRSGAVRNQDIDELRSYRGIGFKKAPNNISDKFPEPYPSIALEVSPSIHNIPFEADSSLPKLGVIEEMVLFRGVHRDTYGRNSAPQGHLLVELGKICSMQRTIAFIVIFILICAAFLMFVEIACDKALRIGLEGFTVRNMTVARMNDSMPWEVTTNIDLTIAVRNPNARLRPCAFKLRRVELSVRYGNNLITSVDVYFGTFSLKPRRRRVVSTKVKVERSQILSDQVGEELEAQLREDAVTLELEINAQYSVRGSSLVVNHKECVVVAKTPQINGSSSAHGRGFLSANCVEKVTA